MGSGILTTLLLLGSVSFEATGVISKLRLAAVALNLACIVRSDSGLVVLALAAGRVSQDMPAAFMAAGAFGWCDADVLGDLKPFLSELLSVVRIVFLLLSGLGLRDVCCFGTANVGAVESGDE